MLNLYMGRADIDKDQLIYDQIKEQRKKGAEKVFVIVPDQFTLQAERTAFEKLKAKGIMDIEILSFSRLAHRVLEETGGMTRTYIDEHGKHMIINKILLESDQTLEVFKGSYVKHSFIDMMNQQISEMKRFNMCPQDIYQSMEKLEDNTILKRKLTDIYHIYQQFNGYLEDKYIDNEDYINLLISKIDQSGLLRDTVVWIDGFDYYTPQTFLVIERLLMTAKEVNMTFLVDDQQGRDRDVFDISSQSIDRLINIANENGIPYQKIKMPTDYVQKKQDQIMHLEKELYAYPYKVFEAETKKNNNKKPIDQAIEITGCSNYYTEAESVAAKMISLVREHGYRFRDMAVICNDLDSRGSIVKRAFEEYGIPCFIDKKRNIMHNPFIELILSLWDVILRGYQYEDIFRLLKTELTDLSSAEYEKLENYALRFKIKGNSWKKDFQYGIKEIGEDCLNEINQIRSKMMEPLEHFEERIHQATAVKEKTTALYFFLRDEYKLAEKIENRIDYLKETGEYEYARETAQIWNVIISIFDQMTELIPNLEIDGETYSSMLRAGFESIEIGVIPTTIDQVIVGTIQRTRIGHIKALFIMGINDGVIPSAMKTEEILHDDEKIILSQNGIVLCKDDSYRIMEEKLAIYRAFSKPADYLWLSYAASDLDGKEIKPSILLERIRKIIGNPPIKKDIVNSEEELELISTSGSTLRHMTEHFRKCIEGETLLEAWKIVSNWYISQSSFEQKINLLQEGLFYNPKVNNLATVHIESLYSDSAAMSATRLETFSSCPFAHFMKYGIRAEERKVFEVAVSEMGEIFHRSLMLYSEEIDRKKMDWKNMDKKRCEAMVNTIIDGITDDYKEGIFENSGKNKYRLSRIKKAAQKTAWILTEHIQKGEFNEFHFEAGFGRNKKYPPIIIEISGGKTVLIEGRIDRIDISRSEDDVYVKVIDYKSGRDSFNLPEMINGLKLQLMLYLRAAISGISCENKGKQVKPAGIFYFKIDDPFIEVESFMDENKVKELAEREMRKHFKMKGLVLDDVKIIKQIDCDIYGSSDIIPVSINKDGSLGKASSVLGEEGFKDLMNHMNQILADICESIMKGRIDIQPKKMDNKNTSCTYCIYKTICRFDISFPDCKYEKANKIKVEDILPT